MNTTEKPRTTAAASARLTDNIEGWADFRRQLCQEPLVRNILDLGADPLFRLIVSPTQEGRRLADWLLYDVLPSLLAQGVCDVGAVRAGDWPALTAAVEQRAREGFRHHARN